MVFPATSTATARPSPVCIIKNTSKDNIGIFSKIAEGGSVSSISIENSFFQGNHYVGSIAGINYGTIEDCTNHSKASASYYVGGIAGENNGLITGCSNTADMSNAGGIATRNYGTISDCTNSGNITSTSSCGGITRWNYGTIINCTNSGVISGSSGAVGGISYTNADGKISHCVNTGAVKGTGTSTTNERVGGIIGWNEGTIEYCVNKGTLSGARTLYDDQFGGIAGRNDDRIRCCANLANLSLTDVNGELLVVSNFTLLAAYRKGNRPDYMNAARPEKAIPLYESFINRIHEKVPVVEQGVFGADMKLSLTNDGPVTIVMDSNVLKQPKK